MPHAFLLSLAVTLGLGAPTLGEERPDQEQLLIAVQRICPVSGQRLGEHGPPVRARIGEQTVYLCCSACERGKVDAAHWSAVQANLARAQQKCPVMNKPLPKNASPTVIDGRVIYICCPPCANKIAADREKYFRAVDDLYLAHLKAERAGPAAQPRRPHHH